MSETARPGEDRQRSARRAPPASLGARIRRAGVMARRLGQGSTWRNYFPEDLAWPWARLILACALAPLVSAVLTAVAYGGVFYATGPETFDLNEHGVEAGHDFVDIYYRAALVWFLPAFVILVAARLRSRRAYGLAAVFAATLEFVVEALTIGYPRPLTFAGAAVLYPMLFLMIRWLAGIRKRAAF